MKLNNWRTKEERVKLFDNSPYKKKERRTTLPNMTKLNNVQLVNKGESLKISKSNFFKLASELDNQYNMYSKENTLNVVSSHKRISLNNDFSTSKVNLSPITIKGDVSPIIKSRAIKNHPSFNFDEDRLSFKLINAAMSKAGNNGGETKTNQDSYLCKIGGMKKEGFNLFAVMDGHGSHGHFISNSVKSLFQEYILKTVNYDLNPNFLSIYKKIQEKDYALLKQCFQYCEASLAKSKYEANFSGTTAVLVAQIDDILICANTGDSRAILCGTDGIRNLSIDHKPDSEGEKQRILGAGGRVEKFKENNEFVGPYRVWFKHEDYPGLAMSRSLGDFVAKSVGCSCMPEIIETKLTSYSQFLIIASDGIWEFLDNAAVCKIVEPYYKKKDPDTACTKLIQEAAKLWKIVSNPL